MKGPFTFRFPIRKRRPFSSCDILVCGLSDAREKTAGIAERWARILEEISMERSYFGSVRLTEKKDKLDVIEDIYKRHTLFIPFDIYLE